MQVGYIGLGNIGAPMAMQLTVAPYRLTVFDVNPASMQAFAGKANLAETAADVGREAEVIGICVRNEDDIRSVLSGPRGLLASIRPGAVILIHSTIAPTAVEQFARDAARVGAHLIDAAVTGAAQGAQTRSICAMVGGAADVVERARPFLDAFCSRIVHAGPLGRGMALKLCNNLVFYMQVRAMNEGFRLAEAAGLSNALREVMTENGNLTRLTQLYVDFREHGRDKLGEAAFRQHNTQMCGLAEKDMELALAYAKDQGLDLPAARQTRALARDTFET